MAFPSHRRLNFKLEFPENENKSTLQLRRKWFASNPAL
jgi:hypothetical protein